MAVPQPDEDGKVTRKVRILQISDRTKKWRLKWFIGRDPRTNKSKYKERWIPIRSIVETEVAGVGEVGHVTFYER